MDYAIATAALEIDASQLDRVQVILAEHFPFDGSAGPKGGAKDKLRGRISSELPMVHFFSFVLFEEEHYDPLLVMQVNIDGDVGPFWAAMEHSFGDELRDLIRCSKAPRDREEPLFRDIVAIGSTTPVAPYLAAKTRKPITPFRGARRFSTQRILFERALYRDIQGYLADGLEPKGTNAEEIHTDLRSTFAARLGEIDPDATPWRAGWRDYASGVLAAVAVLLAITFVLGAPAFILAFLVAPEWIALAALAVAGGMFFSWRSLVKDGREIPRFGKKLVPVVAILIAIGGALFVTFLTASGALFFSYNRGASGDLCIENAWGSLTDACNAFFDFFAPFPEIFCTHLPFIVAGFWVGMVMLIAGVIRLRKLETLNATHDGVKLSEEKIRVRDYEDWGVQNTMCSLLTVKPGILPTIILRFAHLVLSRLARTAFTDGELGPMRTIHFAHWAVLNRDGRLIFFSNFDGSWESYLNDFTEKASVGVNLAWSQCLGFPPNMYVVFGGSERGRQFKTWARHSMAQTKFWYSAYPDLTVEMIHRNARVAAGLKQHVLDDPDAWTRDL